jgi:hypothetical protein
MHKCAVDEKLNRRQHWRQVLRDGADGRQFAKLHVAMMNSPLIKLKTAKFRSTEQSTNTRIHWLTFGGASVN